jgi:hypothetical protein
LPEERFWKLTPRQLHVLMQRKRQNNEHFEEHLEFVAGVIAAHIATYAGKMLKPGVEVAPSDIMPRLKARKRKQELALPPDLIASNIRSFLMAQVNAQQHGS